MTGAGAIPVVPSAGDAGRIEGGHSGGREGNSDGRGREGAENLHCGLLTEYYYVASMRHGVEPMLCYLLDGDSVLDFGAAHNYHKNCAPGLQAE